MPCFYLIWQLNPWQRPYRLIKKFLELTLGEKKEYNLIIRWWYYFVPNQLDLLNDILGSLATANECKLDIGFARVYEGLHGADDQRKLNCS